MHPREAGTQYIENPQTSVGAAILAESRNAVGCFAGSELIVHEQHPAGWNADAFSRHEHHTYHVGGLAVWAHNAPCCKVGKKTSDSLDISQLELGDLIGQGGNKDVFAYGDDKAVGVLRTGKDPAVILREISMLDRLKAAGLPTLIQAARKNGPF